MRHPMNVRPGRVEADAFRALHDDRRRGDTGEQHLYETAWSGMKLTDLILARIFRGMDESTKRLQEIRDSYRRLNFEMYHRQLRSFRNRC